MGPFWRQVKLHLNRGVEYNKATFFAEEDSEMTDKKTSKKQMMARVIALVVAVVMGVSVILMAVLK